MTSRRNNILNRSSTQIQTELPTQEEQIRGYRQMARNRHQVARTTRRVFGRNNYNRTLETAVDPERQLEISRERRANLVPAEVLYSNNRSTTRHRVYEHYSEQRVLCVRENQINLRQCNDESYKSLRNSGLQHIHLGIFMIRLHALHRRSTETNALVILQDTRWEDSRQIIATMEVDLSAGTQLVYTFPDMIISVNDFHNHVEVAIQTHGYDTWQGGKSNLWITMALTGRLSNTSYMGFQYSVENVVDHLTTNGITAIPDEKRSIEELEGMSWNLKPPEQTSVHVPSRVVVNKRLNRSVSLRFERYREKWSTLGEPSGKWDYYVRCDVPLNTTPIEEVTATGWGKEFSDDEVTPGKVTILSEMEEESDWDDDERSSGKTIFATQKQRSELEWENPFAAKHGEDHTMLHISKEKDDLPYLKFRKFEQLAAQIVKRHKEHAFPIAADDAKSSISYQPPLDAIMGPAVYPPARQNPQQAYRPDYQFEMCKDAALAKELRDLSLCSAILIPGYYKNNRKKYGIRKSRTYKGKPHNSYVKPFKRKYKDDRGRVKKCKCFICGKKGHFAKDCRNFDDSSVYSISEGEGDVHQNISIMVQDTPIEEAAFMAIEESDNEQDIEEEYDSHHAFMFHPGPPTKIADMVQSAGSWKPDKELPTQSKSCEHDWKENTVINYTIYYYCGILTTDMSRLNCPKCQLTSCTLCAQNYLGKIVNVKRKQQHKPEEEKDFNSNEEKKDKEMKVQFSKEEFPPLGNSQIARPFMEAEAHYSGSTTTAPKIRKITNQLYNVKVEFEIPNCPMFGCCINKKVIPEEALEPLTQTVFFNGLNSRQQATHRIKQGYFLIEGNKFKIPLIYAFDMRDSNGIEMLIGANFLRSMRGRIRIEGDEIIIYKKVTRIKTSNQIEIVEIAELEVSEEEFLEINKSIYFNQVGSKAFLEQFKPVIDRLKHQGYIRKEPLKHWKKNGKLCKMDIINPDITIEDKPLKHVTPAMEDSFKKHVDSLLKIGAIRPSKSRHRTMAMIVHLGTTIDPVTGKEVKGKEIMVFNYKSLNENTYKDQYSLPGINTIIKRIGGAKIFLKFNLKSGFHQVAMDEESIL
nr:retrotransposon protein, putative, Ty3-gypsy subclass [Tanacetum cinerariifolium]